MVSQNRKKIIDELNRLGVYDASMDSFSINVLEAMLAPFQKAGANAPKRGHYNTAKTPSLNSPKLSHSDVEMLRLLAKSKEKLSARSLSKELGIPITTVQRRRKRLENEFVETKYTLKYEKFGFRKAALFIHANSIGTRDIGSRILAESETISVEITIGQNGVNIMAEVLFRDDKDLLDIIEKVKSFGADNVTWMEVLDVLQTKTNALLNVLENH